VLNIQAKARNKGIRNSQKNLPHGLSSLNQPERSRKSLGFEHHPRTQKPDSGRLDSEHTSPQRQTTNKSELEGQEGKSTRGKTREQQTSKKAINPLTDAQGL
jgi:hypothetical protein